MSANTSSFRPCVRAYMRAQLCSPLDTGASLCNKRRAFARGCTRTHTYIYTCAHASARISRPTFSIGKDCQEISGERNITRLSRGKSASRKKISGRERVSPREPRENSRGKVRVPCNSHYRDFAIRRVDYLLHAMRYNSRVAENFRRHSDYPPYSWTKWGSSTP